MSSIKQLQRADARLVILRVLSQDRGYSANHRILRISIDQLAAITLNDDQVKEHLSWLEDRGAVTTDSVPPFTLAKLTDYGLSLAEGHATLDGVSRPRPDQL
ncbi:MAG: ArsR family transcriptional regulator [Boseongicola sp. SB0673_bin_14]|nr:ArsR family transcriptional regulator [Boseongicola sp. SB0667_bin_21]MYI68201.1 ArsR family transcriptional regulator [Boseongicola sp. SB0673_bin_14]